MMAATHDGHRKRMRERFRISGLEGFSEHEVLELILFYGRARGNVNDTAHALMDVFGSLPRVLEASPEQLMLIDGIGEESATLLSLILPLFRRYSDEVNQVRSKLDGRQVTLDYCRTMMAGYRREQFYVICLTADGSIICNRKVTEGTLSAVTAYPRLVLEAALNSNAHSVVLCHNHPGGVALPSEDDVCDGTPGEGVACRAGRSAFWINWQGGMTPCGMMTQPLFSVPELGFAQAWERTKAATERIRLPGACAGCRLKEICHACAAMCVTETGHFDVKPAYLCDMTHETVRLTLKEAEQ